ncbi:MAG: GNAT family N-acetyltransferase [Rhodospirillaceae bacterium]
MIIHETLIPAPEFAPFTYARYRPLLLAREPAAGGHRCRVIGAWVNGREVGAALVFPFYEDRPRYRLLSVFVAPDHRRGGIGSALLAAAEGLVAAAGGCEIMAVHSNRLRGIDAYLGLMRGRGWSAPELLETRIMGPARWVHAARESWTPLFARLDSLGYSTTPYFDKTPEDDAAIHRLESEGLVEPMFRTPEFIDHGHPLFSLVLRQHGAVVGWIIGEVGTTFNGIHYTLGYVRPDLRRSGWLLRGLWDVSHRQYVAFGPDSISAFETPGDNTAMTSLIQRRLRPLFPEGVDMRFTMSKQISA